MRPYVGGTWRSATHVVPLPEAKTLPPPPISPMSRGAPSECFFKGVFPQNLPPDEEHSAVITDFEPKACVQSTVGMHGCAYGCEMHLRKSIHIKNLQSDHAFQGCVSGAELKHSASPAKWTCTPWGLPSRYSGPRLT